MLVGTLQPPRYFMAEASIPSAIPRTPPYTPQFMGPKPQRRPVRADSPASPTPVLPTETISPAKKAAHSTATAVSDSLQIQELVEGDAGYHTDANVVLPTELEEAGSGSEDNDDDEEEDEDHVNGDDDVNHNRERLDEHAIDLSSDSEGSETGISHRFSRMGYIDGDNEAEFHNVRREHHLRRRRTLSRAYKRSHSQSVTRDLESSDLDPDCMADHDHERSARRLRRRVRGPVVDEESSPHVRPMSISPSPVPFGHLASLAVPSRPTSVASNRPSEPKAVPSQNSRSMQMVERDDDADDDDDENEESSDEDDDDDDDEDEDDSDDEMDVDDG